MAKSGENQSLTASSNFSAFLMLLSHTIDTNNNIKKNTNWASKLKMKWRGTRLLKN